jgi:hypothetical protein
MGKEEGRRKQSLSILIVLEEGGPQSEFKKKEKLRGY